jgi:hypothetical protein
MADVRSTVEYYLFHGLQTEYEWQPARRILQDKYNRSVAMDLLNENPL